MSSKLSNHTDSRVSWRHGPSFSPWSRPHCQRVPPHHCKCHMFVLFQPLLAMLCLLSLWGLQLHYPLHRFRGLESIQPFPSVVVELPEYFPHTVVYRDIQALEEINLAVINHTLGCISDSGWFATAQGLWREVAQGKYVSA